jgi:hypothetical protein
MKCERKRKENLTASKREWNPRNSEAGKILLLFLGKRGMEGGRREESLVWKPGPKAEKQKAASLQDCGLLRRRRRCPVPLL